jgi:hypothetical protein
MRRHTVCFTPVVLTPAEMEIGRIIVQDQLGKKFQRLQLNQKLGVGICLSSQLHRKPK